MQQIYSNKSSSYFDSFSRIELPFCSIWTVTDILSIKNIIYPTNNQNFDDIACQSGFSIQQFTKDSMITIMDDKEKREKLLGFDFSKSNCKVLKKTPIKIVGKQGPMVFSLSNKRKEITKLSWLHIDMLKDFQKLIREYEDLIKPPKLEEDDNDLVIDLNEDQNSVTQNRSQGEHRLVRQLEAHEILAREWIKGGGLCQVDNIGRETITLVDRNQKKKTIEEKEQDKLNKVNTLVLYNFQKGRIVIQVLEPEKTSYSYKVMRQFTENGKPQGSFEDEDCVDKILNSVQDPKNGNLQFFVSWKTRQNSIKPLPTWLPQDTSQETKLNLNRHRM